MTTFCELERKLTVDDNFVVNWPSQKTKITVASLSAPRKGLSYLAEEIWSLFAAWAWGRCLCDRADSGTFVPTVVRRSAPVRARSIAQSTSCTSRAPGRTELWVPASPLSSSSDRTESSSGTETNNSQLIIHVIILIVYILIFISTKPDCPSHAFFLPIDRTQYYRWTGSAPAFNNSPFILLQQHCADRPSIE